MALLQHFFEEQAKQRPNHLALICDELRLTYYELELMANQFSHFLISKEIKCGDKIALLLPKTADLYIAILGILKAGCVYVPIEPEYPSERIEYIVSDSQSKLLITLSQFSFKLQSTPCHICYTDQIQIERDEQPYHPITFDFDPRSSDDLCYIIYTSGSTGKPKGVEIQHKSVCNYIQAATNIYSVTFNDRVYQGFSIAFDASVEEIWLALFSGATLVTASSSAIHNGANLIEFLNLHEVSVFSTVPTLLSMLEGTLPHLRVLILGGESCSPQLITRWSQPHIKIFNTYGPTETAIVTTYKECRPGEPITIGKPIPNCHVFILDNNLQPTLPGQVGEIYIGGTGLARGYTNPSLTKERFTFIQNLKQRVYRTSDLGYFLENGDIQYVGRLDDQVKIRGFRIELAEIESALLKYPSVTAAAVSIHELVEGVQTLVAYLILKDQQDLNQDHLKKILHDHLPDYMIPNVFEIVNDFPRLATGKVNRKLLPKPSHRHHNTVDTHYVTPKTKTQKLLAQVWEELFNQSPISIRANFFHDLGGHSLLATKMVSTLRNKKNFQYLSTLDLYENPTIEQLAIKIAVIRRANQDIEKTEEKISASKSLHRRFLVCSIGQLFGLYAKIGISSWEFLLFFLSLKAIMFSHSIWSFPFLSTLALLLIGINPLLFLLTIGSKWLILGRVKPGEYPIWGFYYFRWWLSKRIQALAPIEYLAGSPLMNIFCRLMGAKIGKNCYIGTHLIDCFDLISMGANTSIGADSNLSGYIVEKGFLKIGQITIGQRCFVGANTILSINTYLKDDSKIDDHSMLPEGGVIQSRQSYRGSPARPGKVTLPTELIGSVSEPKRIKIIQYALLHCMALAYILLLYAVTLIPGIALVDYYFFHLGTHWLRDIFIIIPLAGFIQTLLLCTLISISKKIILGKVKPGIYSLYSHNYVRKWLFDKLIKLSQGSMYATLYLPLWLRTLGAKIGKRAEISTVSHIAPDLLTIEDESFLADGVSLGVPRIYKNSVSIAVNKIGKRTFIGNGAFVPQETHLGDSCLIGCLSIAPNKTETCTSNTAWLGSPPIFLPKRQIFSGFSEKETYIPTFSRYLQRGIFDFLRTIAPNSFLYLLLALQFFSAQYLMNQFSLLGMVFLFPLFTAGITTGILLLITALKWVLMGKYKERVKPLWSLFVWRNELLTGFYDFIMVPFLLEDLTGTPFLAFFLRLLGAKIGKHCFINTTAFTEFDLVDIGDRVTLNASCTIQTHLFEDRVMKMAKLKISDDCHVGNMAIVLYDTLMEKGASLNNLSLLMKGETLPDYSQWCGIPAQPLTSLQGIYQHDYQSETDLRATREIRWVQNPSG